MTGRPELAFACAHLTDERVCAHQLAALGSAYDCSVFVFRDHDSMAGMAQQIISAIPARLTWIGLSLGELMTDLARSVEAMGQLHQQTARSGPPHSHADLPRARVPTLVMFGGQDPVTPLADHQAMAACVTGAERQVIESCGHLSTIEPPHAVRPAWTWWPRATD